MMKRWIAFLLSVLLLAGTAMETFAAGETAFSPCENLEYDLTSIDGGQISTKAAGKPKVLIFFKKDCYNCRYMLSLFRDTARNLDAVDIIAAEFAQASLEDTQTFYSEYGTEKVQYCYGASSAGWSYVRTVQSGSSSITTPLVVYIDRNNRIVQYSTGMDADILNHIEEYLSVSLPEPESTPIPDSGSTPTPDSGDTSTPDSGSTPTPDSGDTPTPDSGSTPTPDNGSTPTPGNTDGGNDTAPAHQHRYVTVTKKATLSANGSVEKKCTECGAVADTQTIYYPKTIKLSKTSYTYNGKARKPSVTVKDSNGKTIGSSNYTVLYSNNKNVGKASVAVKFKGNYSGTAKKTFTIQPKTTSLQKVTAKSKGFSAKWKKQTSQVTGYEIQYSTSSKFAKSKTSKVIVSKSKTTTKAVSKLKAKKKYYVRIRTYKNVKINGKTTRIYSEWSKARTVVTKK